MKPRIDSAGTRVWEIIGGALSLLSLTDSPVLLVRDGGWTAGGAAGGGDGGEEEAKRRGRGGGIFILMRFGERY